MVLCRPVACGRVALAAVLAMLTAGAVAAQSVEADLRAPLQEVAFGPGDTLRGLVGEYLKDPDLWPAVLRINGIASPAELVPGMALRMPVRQVAAADSALVASLEAIQRANAEGAGIFAPREIETAIETRETAIASRGMGEWRQVVDHAGAATELAREALEISLKQRDRSAEAVVTDVQGAVEGRAPAEPRWSDRAIDDVLVEFERVRTLTQSTTQITFRDLSRLRLNPNSNATIQRMRSDPLTGGEVTKVSLANGDFYALLNQLSDKSRFEIDVPGVEAATNSGDFWVRNDREGARFVNYDGSAELRVRRGGEEIRVGENEGVVLTGRGALRAEVLDSPVPVAPGVDAVVYTRGVGLEWQPYEGAAGYWLEIASDPGFNRMQVSQWGLRETGFVAQGLAPSRYHWRVAALDRLGLPGQWSTPRAFTLREDATPPFLTLLAPGSDVRVSRPRVEVLGASEPDAQVTLNGTPLTLGADGSFLATIALAPGENAITVVATDPAGNVSERGRVVTYRPVAEVDIVLSEQIARVDGALATRSDELSVAGVTSAEPGAPVAVRGATGEEVLRTQVGAGGEIRFSVPVDEAARRFVIEVLAPDGSVEGELAFEGLRDRTPPRLTLDQPPPRATAEPELRLSGAAGDAVELTVNGAPAELDGRGRFAAALRLVPGANDLEFLAVDAVGNVAALRLRTVLDLDPPQVLAVDLGRPGGGNGPIELVVEAQDESGLVQAAPFILSIGGEEVAGFARCDSAAGRCRATLPAQPGRLELVELIVEDYAGNAAFE